MSSLLDRLGAQMFGHVLIRDVATGQTLLDQCNAIHVENMSQALALSLANRVNGHIHQMVFGNGGSTASSVGTITYLPPNVTGQTATLYNQTYSKVVDDLSPLNTDPLNNKLRVLHSVGQPYSDIQITCTLNATEPAGQLAFDDSPLTNNQNASGTSGSAAATYIFDELGLRSYDPSGNGLLLTHVIFHPIQKALNRSIEVIYTIRTFMT